MRADHTHRFWAIIAGGDFTGPERRPMGRLTIDHLWNLNLGFGPIGGYGPDINEDRSRLPVRWWASTSASWKNEVEIPNVKSLHTDWSVEQDAATAEFIIYNTDMTSLTVGGLVGDPGHMTPTRGADTNPWGHTANSWADLLNESGICRSFEGFGGYNADGSMKSIATCLANDYIVQTGTWYIDDVDITTDGLIKLTCRDMIGPFLIDQFCFPPLVPRTFYPVEYTRFAVRNIDTPRIDYGSHTAGARLIVGGAPGPVFTDAAGHESTGYWLSGDDGGIFTYGSNEFHGSNIAVPAHAVVGMATNGAIGFDPHATGYWVGTNQGDIFTFGGATNYGSLIIDPIAGAFGPWVDICAPSQTTGLYMVTDQGDVGRQGSTPFAAHPTTPAPIVAIASRPFGDGVILVNANGQHYCYGAMPYAGNTPNSTGSPAVDVITSATGNGYATAQADGRVYCQPTGTMVRVPIREDVTAHGRQYKYSQGCRCELCRAANTRTMRDYKAGVRHKKGPDVTGMKDVPIETLAAGDRVVSYGMGTRRLRKTGCRIVQSTTRAYDGELVVITTEDGQMSRYTPDHHCVVRIGDTFDGSYVVYMMRRGNQYRVGKSRWKYRSQSNASGPWIRCRDEGGDAFWILSVHETESAALLAEALVGQEFNIPTWTFVDYHKPTKREGVVRDTFWSKVGDNTEKATAALRSFGRAIEHPFWDNSNGRLFTRRAFLTRACNIVSGMTVGVPDLFDSTQTGQLYSNRNGWSPVRVTREWYTGDVVTLSVEGDHTYIADGIVTHNCFGDMTFYGDASALTLSDPISSMMLTPSGFGYWLIAEDGGVFSYGDAVFYGSLVGESHLALATDGNITDFVDVVRDFLLWSGWWLHDEVDSSNMPAIYGSLEATGSYPVDIMPHELFDKQKVLDCITKIKEVVGFSLMARYDGSVQFSSPNWWGPGNFLPDGTHTTDIPVIDERYDLLQYAVKKTDRPNRTNIIVTSDDPITGGGNTITANYIVPTPPGSYDRGLVKPTMLVNSLFSSSLDQEIMAELIALHIMFQRRLGSATHIGSPLQELDDQVQIFEQQTEEYFIHYVRGITRDLDMDAGSYVQQTVTNWLGSATAWTIDLPAGYAPIPGAVDKP